MESDKAILIESDPDLQLDAENQQTSVNIVPSNEQPPPPYDEVAAGLQKEQHSLRRPTRGLIVRRAGPSWGPIDSPIVLACIAFLFCGIFGIVALVLAFYSGSLSLNRDLVKSRRMVRTSYIVSASGILTGIILILVLGILLQNQETYWNNNMYNKVAASGYMTSPRMGERSTSIHYERWGDRSTSIDYKRWGEPSTSIDYKRLETRFGYNVSDDGCGSQYNVQACETYGSYKDYYNCTKCCPAIANGSCTYGWAKDYYGCRRGCCEYYSNASCEAYGSYIQSYRFSSNYGCIRCCPAIASGTCTYGWAKDSNDCRMGCCEYYDNSSCLSNGFYFDSYDGCKHCCSGYNVLDCMRFGSYMYSGCLQCCGHFNSSNCPYGWKLDSNGCKTCCYYREEFTCSHELVTVPGYMEMTSPRMGESSTSTDMNEETSSIVSTGMTNPRMGESSTSTDMKEETSSIVRTGVTSPRMGESSTSIDYKRGIGYNKDESDGCRKQYDVQACETYGSYKDSDNCTTCCRAIANGRGCTYGWAKDYYGCRRGCCEYYSNASCEAYGSYIESYIYSRNHGCIRCCPAIASGTCTYGWAKDSNGCRMGCCEYYNNASCEAYGSYIQSNSCKQCCSYYNVADCNRYGSYNDQNTGCRSCCSYYNVADCNRYGSYNDQYTGCRRCCGDTSQCTYGWKLDDSTGCKRCCEALEEYLCHQ